MIDFLKIVLLCVAGAVVYGIVHDQLTARVCLEYFTVFHPQIFPTRSPTLLAFGWGILATWWVGAFLGILLATASRIGQQPKLTVRDVLPHIARLLFCMGVCAFLGGLIGFFLARRGLIAPPPFVAQTPGLVASHFMADWWAHGASYAIGLFGGLGVCVAVYRKRLHLGRTLGKG